jgi:hypothetical protein
VLTLEHGSKNYDVFLGKGLGDGSGSCSVNENGEYNFVADMVPYRVEVLLETEPLAVHPVAVIDGQELPEAVSCYWVVEWAKFCVMLWVYRTRGMRSRCGLCLQLLKQIRTRVCWLALLIFLAKQDNKGKWD